MGSSDRDVVGIRPYQLKLRSRLSSFMICFMVSVQPNVLPRVSWLDLAILLALIITS